ncbi:MAG: efflux RND transporter periplasmic adaptor subunit [Candidatus Brocadiia bacterium]
MKRIFFTIVTLAFLAGVVYVGLKVRDRMAELAKGPPPKAAPQIPVEVASAGRATLRETGSYNGNLECDSMFVIAPQVGGRLLKMSLNVGDQVKRGQLIAELDSRDFAQAIDKAKADLAVSEAGVREYLSSIDTAKREYERIAALYEKKFASESERDQAQVEVQVLEARLGVAKAQVELRKTALSDAELRLTYTKVYALWEGGPDTRTVGEKFVEQETLLSQNEPIVSVIDIATLKAVIKVSELEFSHIALQQSASMNVSAYPDKKFTGRISRIAPQFDDLSRQVRVEVRVANSDGLLRPGMYVTVELQFSERRDVQVVPIAALVSRDGSRGIFVVAEEGKKARFVPLQLGISNNEVIEVISPAVTEQFVVIGQHLLFDGIGIKVVKPGNGAPSNSPAPGAAVEGAK